MVKRSTVKYLVKIITISACLLSVACGTVEHKKASQLAVLASASSSSRSVINTAISTALNESNVVIATTAFINSPHLTLQRNTKDPNNMKGLNGRLLGRPVLHHFSLIKQRDSCYLLAQKTNKQYLLSGVSCRSV